MIFWTNTNKEKVKQLQELMELIDLKYEIKEEAFDMFGRRLPNDCAVYFEQDKYKNRLVMELDICVNREVRKQWRALGADGNKVHEYLPDMYSYEIYFPEYKGMLKPIDINALHQKVCGEIASDFHE